MLLHTVDTLDVLHGHLPVSRLVEDVEGLVDEGEAARVHVPADAAEELVEADRPALVAVKIYHAVLDLARRQFHAVVTHAVLELVRGQVQITRIVHDHEHTAQRADAVLPPSLQDLCPDACDHGWRALSRRGAGRVDFGARTVFRSHAKALNKGGVQARHVDMRGRARRAAVVRVAGKPRESRRIAPLKALVEPYKLGLERFAGHQAGADLTLRETLQQTGHIEGRREQQLPEARPPLAAH